MVKFILQDAIPGLFLIGLGFWAGSTENVFFALTGFLACFITGVILIVEGYKKRGKPKDERASK